MASELFGENLGNSHDGRDAASVLARQASYFYVVGGSFQSSTSALSTQFILSGRFHISLFSGFDFELKLMNLKT